MKKIFSEFFAELSVLLLFVATIGFFLMFKTVEGQGEQIKQIQLQQTKLEKRVNNLSQALTTKDKEIETGLRQVQDGIMLKIDWLENTVDE